MKTFGIVTAAIFLGLGGAAVAGNDNQDSQQNNTNATGPNPYMTFSTPSKLRSMWQAEDAFAVYSVQHFVAKPQVKK